MHIDLIQGREYIVVCSHFSKGAVDIFFCFAFPLTKKEIVRAYPQSGALALVKDIHIPPFGICPVPPLDARPELALCFVAVVGVNGDKLLAAHFITSSGLLFLSD